MTRIRDAATGLPGVVHVADDATALADQAAAWVMARAEQVATPGGGRAFSIALAGGSTPERLYRLLASAPYRDLIDWSRWQVFFGDERAAAPDAASSNFAMARHALLDHVPLPPAHLQRMEADDPDLAGAARRYSDLLEAMLPRSPDGSPQLDCMLLGLGTNGHTASLFPGTPALDVTDAWATTGRADVEPVGRITLTFPAINAAGAVAFLVSGDSKADALREVRAGTAPAARVDPVHGELTWFLDAAAAGALG